MAVGGRQVSDDGRKARLLIIAIVAVSVISIYVAVSILGNRRVNDEAARIRRVAAEAHVDLVQLAASLYNGDTNPVADVLRINDSDVELRLIGGSWCATVAVHRLMSTQSISFMLTSPGQLHEVNTCS